MIFIYVFLGGGIGSMLRYGASFIHIPHSTLVVNILGSFLIGLFYSLSSRFGWSDSTRLLLTTGLCGGFTTFSTFSNESLELIKSGNYFYAISYILVSIIIGILAAWFGYYVTKVF